MEQGIFSPSKLTKVRIARGLTKKELLNEQEYLTNDF